MGIVTAFLGGLLAGALLMVLVYLALRALRAVQNEPAPTRGPGSPSALVAGALLLAMAGVEEAVFRWLLLDGLARLFGTPGAVVASSLLFGVSHVPNTRWVRAGDGAGAGGAGWARGPAAVGFVAACASGAAFAYLRLLTGGLAAPVGAHFGWNFLQWPVLGFPLYGAPSPLAGRLCGVVKPYRRTRPSGPWWLSGGSFGAEGSVLALAAWAAVLVTVASMAAALPTAGGPG